MFAALEALLDSLLERYHRLLPLPEDREHPGNTDDRHRACQRAAINMAMPATHLIADILRRVFWGFIEDVEAHADAVTQWTFGNRCRVWSGPFRCRSGSVS